ncbi:phytoene desaturase family protein [Planctomycetota bacterium]
MRRDYLRNTQDEYDAIVIGSGLGGLTAANILARQGASVLLLEQHYNYGGLATWFHRKGGHIFDISLHGFPYNMKKSCRKYWNKEIAGHIVQLKEIRFKNPQFELTTTYDEQDFRKLMTGYFGIKSEAVESFFETVRGMRFYDDQTTTTRELFQRFFPDRTDVWRLLMEPITYANGSNLDDPAITYGIVFSNFMNKGVYIFRGGTDLMIKLMKAELRKNGVDMRKRVPVQKVLVENGQAAGVIADGKTIRAKAVISNAGLKNTIFDLAGCEHFSPGYLRAARAVRLNNSSCQVYIGLKRGAVLPHVGDLLFTSTHAEYDWDALLAKNITSRTFSMYYPQTRPHRKEDRYIVVSSTNALWQDWANLPEEEYHRDKDSMIEDTLRSLEGYFPDIRDKIDWLEASTPRTFQHYTRHYNGATFGTKFEGLEVSRRLPGELPGLFHTGSVGIIMSGWLGALNYGVIVANNADRFLHAVQT